MLKLISAREYKEKGEKVSPSNTTRIVLTVCKENVNINTIFPKVNNHLSAKRKQDNEMSKISYVN